MKNGQRNQTDSPNGSLSALPEYKDPFSEAPSLDPSGEGASSIPVAVLASELRLLADVLRGLSDKSRGRVVAARLNWQDGYEAGIANGYEIAAELLEEIVTYSERGKSWP